MCNCGKKCQQLDQCSRICNQPIPHKWAKEIKAWADGSEIESRSPENMVWKLNHCPLWQIENEYRIKPSQETYAAINKDTYISHRNKALDSSSWNAGAQAVIVEFCRRNAICYNPGIPFK